MLEVIEVVRVVAEHSVTRRNLISYELAMEALKDRVVSYDMVKRLRNLARKVLEEETSKGKSLANCVGMARDKLRKESP